MNPFKTSKVIKQVPQSPVFARGFGWISFETRPLQDYFWTEKTFKRWILSLKTSRQSREILYALEILGTWVVGGFVAAAAAAAWGARRRRRAGIRRPVGSRTWLGRTQPPSQSQWPSRQPPPPPDGKAASPDHWPSSRSSGSWATAACTAANKYSIAMSDCSLHSWSRLSG